MGKNSRILLISVFLYCLAGNIFAMSVKFAKRLLSGEKPAAPSTPSESLSADLDDNGVLTIVFSELEGMATIRVKDSNNIIIEEFSATTFLPIAIYLDQSFHYQIIEITTNQGSYEASIINP